VSFEAGPQLMDGQRALIFTRSRHAEGQEGSDFARSARQQLVIAAIKEKMLSPGFFFSPGAIVGLLRTARDYFQIDLPREKLVQLARLALRFRSENLKMVVLDGERLVNPPPSQALYDGQWVLVPKTGNWEEIQAYVDNLLESEN
jgi:anionic cell wall polymer biosynthesis LytR-Cps2A-Psr (LCP) family protein